MESAQLPLDQLIARYEEGEKLVRLCQEKLDAAQQKIQIITAKCRRPCRVGGLFRPAPMNPKPLLPRIQSPEDIKALDETDLPCCAQEVRNELIRVLSQTGGRIGPISAWWS